jgi:hypothetical protein
MLFDIVINALFECLLISTIFQNGTMSNMKDTILLKKSTKALFLEDFTEIVISCESGFNCFVQVNGYDTLSEIRHRLENFLEKGTIISNFMFKVNSIIIPKKEEINTPVFQVLGRTIYLVSACHQINSICKIGPNVIVDD